MWDQDDVAELRRRWQRLRQLRVWLDRESAWAAYERGLREPDDGGDGLASEPRCPRGHGPMGWDGWADAYRCGECGAEWHWPRADDLADWGE